MFTCSYHLCLFTQFKFFLELIYLYSLFLFTPRQCAVYIFYEVYLIYQFKYILYVTIS